MRVVATPRLYLGTMTFGWSNQTSAVVDQTVANQMCERFVEHNLECGRTVNHVDTARIYAGGKTEPMVGNATQELCNTTTTTTTTIVLGTKAHPSVKGGLSPDGLHNQLKTSLDDMKVVSLGEYYLHQPDTKHTLLDSLKTAHKLVTSGVVAAIGMSNYHSSEMERAFQLCEKHGLTPPTVYQGLYNPLNRMAENDLIPILKQNKCSFVAYNPLAAGLLAGKHSIGDAIVKPGRFKDNPNYLPRFYTDSNFAAIDLIRKVCEKDGISMVEATYRWLLRHSALGENDGLLLGASSLEQLDQNLLGCAAATEKGSLSEEMLRAFEEAWEITSEGAFPYWRSYSADMPNCGNLDQGASYEAKKK